MRKKSKDLAIRVLKRLLEKLGVRTVERDGVFAVVRNPNNTDEVLLVRHGYGTKKWSLPGGGIKQGEFAPDAIMREVLDETGFEVGINKHVAYLSLELKYGFTSLFECHIVGGALNQKGNGQEITECRFFHKDSLPNMYNAQKGMIGWAEYHKLGGEPLRVLYGWPNKPPLKQYRTEQQ